jgi:hypothetical protein
MLAAICICSFWTESQISLSFVNYKKVDMPNSITQGRHLLGYCYLNLGEVERALREFKRCIKGTVIGALFAIPVESIQRDIEDFDDDWQLVVELTIEAEQRRRKVRAELEADEAPSEVGTGIF